MKKLLLLLLCVPLIGLGQTAYDYYEKANDYAENGEYQLAIDNYTKSLRIDPDYADAYTNRGISYRKLGNYEDAIDDYTRAIRIGPDDSNYYWLRGNAKKSLGLSYCSDYKRACNLGNEECCEWYDDQCK